MRNTDTTNANIRWRELREERIAEYNKNPKLCKYCKNPLSYDKYIHKYIFCSRSCSAMYNNKHRKYKKKNRECIICGKQTSSIGSLFCEPWGVCQSIYNMENAMKNRLQRSKEAIRRYLILTRGNKCQSCGIGGWLGKNLPLESHHIDGNSKNNEEENLMLLCPNCHSITDNYRGKNRGNGHGEYKRNRK